jgi:hypothetical protein
VKQYLIRLEGIGNPCPNHAAVYTEKDLEAEGGTNEFIQEGIHVIEYSAFQAELKKRDVLIAALESGIKWCKENQGYGIAVACDTLLNDVVKFREGK